jgi:PDZ domain-containing secreted protein
MSFKTILGFAALLCALPISLIAQDKATIKIRKEVDGKVEVIEKEIVLGNDGDINELLKELDILREAPSLQNGQSYEIIVRRLDDPAIESIEVVNKGVEKAFLGVMLTSPEKRGLDVSGAYIKDVIPGTGAEDANLQAGDVITKVEKEDISSYQDLIAFLKTKSAGDKVKITYLRDGKKATTKATLGEEMKQEKEFVFMNEPPADERFDFKTSPKAFMGVTPGAPCEKGVRLGNIVKESAAEEAGLIAGDIVLSISGNEVNTFHELSAVIANYEPNDKAEVTFLRSDVVMTLPIAFKSREAATMGDMMFYPNELGIDEDGDININLEIDGDMMQWIADSLKFPENFDLNLEGIDEIMNTIELSIEGLESGLSSFEKGMEAFENFMEEIIININVMEVTPEEMAVINMKADVKLTPENSLELNTIALFPNPNDGIFTIDFSLNENNPTRVILYSASGEMLLNDTVKAINGTYKRSIDFRDQANGNYFLQIVQGDKSWSGKIAKTE